MAQIKLHNAQDAIEQAIEGGWDRHRMQQEFDPPLGDKQWFQDSKEKAFTDPLFWQALGKARGWQPGERDDGSNYETSYTGEWEVRASDWFSNRIVGGDETKFWESLP